MHAVDAEDADRLYDLVLEWLKETLGPKGEAEAGRVEDMADDVTKAAVNTLDKHNVEIKFCAELE